MQYVGAEQIQVPIPDAYYALSDAELAERIGAARRALGRDVVILGHHYQRDEIIRWADFTGDSYKLSRLAQGRPEARYIVFCGVHFMAETADILSTGEQQVVLPDLSAGCSMADMASLDEVEEAWEELCARLEGGVVPITYMNSAADIKAFCGRNGGAVCTSSNAVAVFRWALQKGQHIFFLPDEHLGRNSAVQLGASLAETAVWNPRRGGLEGTPEQVQNPRYILWKGFCSVHQKFKPAHVAQVRAEHPGIQVAVHPECSYEVVQLADVVGSTEKLIEVVSAAPTGSSWAIGTEINLISRLAKAEPDKLVISLSGNVCPCATMYRISPPHLCWALENLVEGRVVNRIQVPDDVAQWARVALERMLEIV